MKKDSKNKWMKMGLEIEKKFNNNEQGPILLQEIVQNEKMLNVLKEIENDLQTVNEQNQKLKQKNVALDQKYDNLVIKKQSLQKEINDLKTAKIQFSIYRININFAISKNLAESKNIEKEIETKKLKAKELTQKIADAENKAYEFQVECQELEESISELKKTIKEAELTVEANKKKLDDFSEEIDKLSKVRYQNEQQDMQLFQQKISKLNVLNKEYEKVNKDLLHLNSGYESLKNKLSEKNKDNHQLEKDLVELTELSHSYQQTYLQETEKNTKLTQKHQECKEEQQKLILEHEILSLQSKQEEEEIAKLQALIKQLEENLDEQPLDTQKQLPPTDEKGSFNNNSFAQEKESGPSKHKKNKKKNSKTKNKLNAESKQSSLMEMEKQPGYKDKWEKYCQDKNYVTAMKFETGDSKTAKSLSKAVEFFKKSPQNPLSRFKLAKYKELGHGGVKLNKEAAFREYKALADAKQPYPLAQYHTGLCYLNAIGVSYKKISKPDAEALAVEYFVKAAREVPQAALEYGHCLEKGRGADVNLSLALEYYKLAQKNWTPQPGPNAIQASIKRVNSLIKSQEQDKQQKKSGKTSKLDKPIQAKKNSSASTEASNNSAQIDEIIALLEKQLEKKNKFLTELKHSRPNAFCKSSDEIILLREKAKKGNPEFQYLLASHYEKLISLQIYSKDEVKKVIFQYYKLSVKGGYKPAIYKLAKCYENGVGTEKNIDKAVDYYYSSFLKDGEGLIKASEYFLKALIKNHKIIIKAATCLTYSFLLKIIHGSCDQNEIERYLKKAPINTVYINTILSVIDYYISKKIDNIDQINKTKLHKKLKEKYERLTQSKHTHNLVGKSSFWRLDAGESANNDFSDLEDKDFFDYASCNKG